MASLARATASRVVNEIPGRQWLPVVVFHEQAVSCDDNAASAAVSMPAPAGSSSSDAGGGKAVAIAVVRMTVGSSEGSSSSAADDRLAAR